MLKTNTKALQEEMQGLEKSILELRYQIPNVPQASVPAGISEEDNEELEKGGSLPTLVRRSTSTLGISQKI